MAEHRGDFGRRFSRHASDAGSRHGEYGVPGIRPASRSREGAIVTAARKCDSERSWRTRDVSPGSNTPAAAYALTCGFARLVIQTFMNGHPPARTKTQQCGTYCHPE